MYFQQHSRFLRRAPLSLLLLLNREGRFHTESAPMESCRPAIIVSFGVTARCGLKGSQRSRNRFRGRVSCLISMVIHDSKHLARPPCKRGLSDDDFQFHDHSPAPKCVRFYPRDCYTGVETQTSMDAKTIDLKQTINLPRTDF